MTVDSQIRLAKLVRDPSADLKVSGRSRNRLDGSPKHYLDYHNIGSGGPQPNKHVGTSRQEPLKRASKRNTHKPDHNQKYDRPKEIDMATRQKGRDLSPKYNWTHYFSSLWPGLPNARLPSTCVTL
jgi:hypothetical protein